MRRTAIYYRVNLESGITVEERPRGFYRDDPEYGRTVFKSIRQAKSAFSRQVLGEIDRLRNLRHAIPPLKNRDELKNHSFSPLEG